MTSKAVLMSSKADEYEKDDCCKLVDSSCKCMVQCSWSCKWEWDAITVLQ